MLKQLLGILFFGFTAISFSQNITIKDKESGEPLESVTLASEDRKVYVVTNNKGQADVSDFVGFTKIVLSIIVAWLCFVPAIADTACPLTVCSCNTTFVKLCFCRLSRDVIGM